MKSKTLNKKAGSKLAGSRKSVSSVVSDVFRFSRRHSAYAFVATLGVWLPKAEAATLVNLDAFTHPLGALNVWTNTGSEVGDFTVPVGATATPTNMVVDGVQGLYFQTGAGGGGAAGSHYIGPVASAAVTGNGARTIEAWIWDTNVLAEVNVFAYGRREGAGTNAFNNSFGHGASDIFGAVGMFLAADLGWGNTAAQVATNIVRGRWTYIVQTFNGTTNAVYVDGRLANSEGPPNAALINTAALANDNATPLRFRVARQNTAAGAISGAGDENVIISRIRVQDVAMSSTSISNQFFIEKATFNLNDTDGDGMPDWWEARFGLDKNNPADASLNGDADGLTNLQEFAANTNPTLADTDADGASDGAELSRVDPQTTLAAPTNPLDSDSDDDGLLDGVESDTGIFVNAGNTGTDPLKGDSDGDIASDGMEVLAGTDPNNGGITPSLARAIDLDASILAGGPLTNWINTGFITGNFSVPTNATVPLVTTNDGVKGVQLLAAGGANTGTHYRGPDTTPAVTGSSPRTVEAWVYDNVPQGEKIIIAWGKRGGATPNGANWPFGIGTDNGFGGVGAWGDPDIGWNDQEAHGRWTHIAATWDGATTRLYSEGVLVNSENLPSAGGQTIATVHLNTLAAPLPFRIGRQNNEAGNIDATGQGQVNISRVRVYTNALDGATIKARFDSEKATYGLVDPDGDGLPTWYEIRWGLAPNDATGANGAAGNPDNDGLTNLQEYQINTGATVADTDADGVNDGPEVNRIDPQTLAPAPTNPLNADSDGDGLRDGVETDNGPLSYVSVTNTGSDPLRSDTDGDTFADGLEVNQGSDPTNPASIPSPLPIISLDATTNAVPLGPLNVWTNTGRLAGDFAAELGGGGTANVGGTVELIQGVRGLTLAGGSYRGTNATFVTGNPNYSVEAWVYNPTIGDEETIIGWGRRGGGDGTMSAFTDGANGTWGAMTHWGAPDLSWNGANVRTPVRWKHLVYTYNAATLTQTVYSDGVQANTEVLAGPLIIADSLDGGVTHLPFRVGNETGGDGNPAGFAGNMTMGEIRVYTRVLPQAEITSSFNAGALKYGILDSDGDGMPDWFERTYPFLNQNNSADAALDQDGDGLNNLGEYQAGSDPSNPDTDGDGLSDGVEVNNFAPRPYPTSPSDPDTDRDGLNDNVETGSGVYVGPQDTGTTANFPDSDGDTYPDAIEVAYRIADGITDPNGVSIPNTAAPVPVVKLDATGLATGPLSTWTNLSGLPSWNFVAPTGAIASVQYVDGTRGVTLNTTNNYTGHGAPVYMAGNASRTVDAWLYNPLAGGEETVFAWGRRGADYGNSAFAHGTDLGFGALQFFGADADVAWGVNAGAIAANVVTSKWTYVTYTYDSLTGIRSCYKDGVLANSETNGATALSTFATNTASGGFVGNALPFRVGAQNEANGALSGAAQPSLTIAKLRVYDLSLTAAQIAATYNAERVQFPGQPKITNVKVNPANGFVSFDWVPTAGRTYAVERNSDVSNPNGWSTIATGQTSGSFTNNPAGAPINHYRLRVEP